MAEAVTGQSEPGIITLSEAGQVEVGTGAGRLRLLRLQRPGGKMLATTDFLRGFPVQAGAKVPSQPMPQLIKP